jgi:hypothetical protein
MSDASLRNGHGGNVTWRAVVGVGLAVLGALLLFVLDIVKDTAKAVNGIQSEVSRITGSYGAQITNHESRIGKLEDWRNSRGHP